MTRPTPRPAAISTTSDAAPPPVERANLRFGWWALLLYLTMGLVLEALHGFKVQEYLNVSNETRRLMWTLAHAHGTLFALINIVFAMALHAMPQWTGPTRAAASRCLLGSLILLPAGFFLGGIWITDRDPGLPIALVPIGALLMIVGVFLTAKAASNSATTHDRK